MLLYLRAEENARTSLRGPATSDVGLGSASAVSWTLRHPEIMADTQNAIEKLAEQAKIAQVSFIPYFVL
jgi:hypothetical protein